MSDAEQHLRLRFGAFDLDERNALLTRDGEAVPLAPKAFAVLCTLARSAGQLVTKEALLDASWGHRHVSESVLKTTISELRAALDDDAREPRYIGTASRRGYRFIASLAAVTGAPQRTAPAIVDNTAAPALIGRAEALARLDGAWSAALEGRRRLVWVAGEAGIGKTTLIDAFTARLGPALVCARGQCVEQFGAAEPYLPMLEALGALCRDDPAMPPLLRAVAPAWLLQLPWLCSLDEREALRRELAGTSPDRMLRELAELLDRYSRERPLLLVTEDLHWSDQATVRLIDHFARRRGPARLMWIGSFRLAELVSEEHPLKGLRHELRAHRLADEILLDPFSEAEVADYLGTRLPGAAPPESFVRSLHDRTEGLPLFLVNVIDDLAARGAIGAAPEGDGLVPESLAGVIEKQIARLPADALQVLEAASVCGMEFRPRTVGAALERTRPEAADSEPAAIATRCEQLVRQQVWLRAGELGVHADGTLDARYVFRHALYRQVFYQRIGALARARLHQHVAAALERERAAGASVTASELASHYELGHDMPAAVRHYADAVDKVLARFAPAEAIELSGKVLALLPRCPEGPARLQLELALQLKRGVACAQLLGMSSPEAKAAHERAQLLCDQLPETPALGWAIGGLSLARYGQGEYDTALSLAQRVHAFAERHDDAGLRISACNILGMSCSARGEIAACRQWLEQGIAAFETLGHVPEARFFVDPVVAMRGHLALHLLLLGRVDLARAQADAALLRGRSIGHPMAEALANRCAGLLEIGLQQPERVAERASVMKALGARHGIGQAQGSAGLLGGWARAHLGDPEAGHAMIIEGLAILQRLGMVAGSVLALGFATEALILTRRWPAAQAQFDEAWQLAQQLGERGRMPELLALRARIELGRGEAPAARASLQASLREARAQGAAWLELAALIALCEPGAASDADLDALQTVCERISGADDSTLMTTARALLGASRRAGSAVD